MIAIKYIHLFRNCESVCVGQALDQHDRVRGSRMDDISVLLVMLYGDTLHILNLYVR